MRKSALLVSLLLGPLAYQRLTSETLTLTTSYPAPSGVYQSVVTTGGTTSSPKNTILVRDAGSVGVGTSFPSGKLEVDYHTNPSGVYTPPGVYISPSADNPVTNSLWLSNAARTDWNAAINSDGNFYSRAYFQGADRTWTNVSAIGQGYLAGTNGTNYYSGNITPYPYLNTVASPFSATMYAADNYSQAQTYVADTDPAKKLYAGMYVDDETNSGDGQKNDMSQAYTCDNKNGQCALMGTFRGNAYMEAYSNGGTNYGYVAPSGFYTTGNVYANGILHVAGTAYTGPIHNSGYFQPFPGGYVVANAGGVLATNPVDGSMVNVNPSGDPGGHAFSVGWDGKFYIWVDNQRVISFNPNWPETGSATKNFIIPHPTDGKKYLVHTTLEGPENAVFYRGQAKLKKGRAEIVLPTYFEALTHEEGRTVLLTPRFEDEREAVSALAHGPVHKGKFIVKAVDGNNPEQAFDWEVKAARKDIPSVLVEPDRDQIEVYGVGPYKFYSPKGKDAPQP